ncbi:hypothetical protein [Streptococcus parasanguinis]|uniref:hypothetical protein n=1 Tax=Streptococcus parasanguinis TaxID=1318 RepID=UPI0012BD4B66|nr:hypothetical protein [Streptococcus parasanguinis]MTR99534.1 hypothetical protein [Streptococcus parasanguinis]MTS11188.1 hypothetical protein [Streptococcus parasanguinis]
MKNKKIISLAALALTATLFLGACGGNKEEKTSEASSSKTSQVKQTSSSSKKKVITSKDPIASSSSDSKSEENHSVGSKTNRDAASQTPAPAKAETPGASATKEVAAPAKTAKEKLPSLEDGHAQAKKQASATENAQYKGVYSVAAGDFSAAAGNWSDKRDTGVTIGQGGQVTIQLPGGQPVAYGISGYNYTLDDGHYHANLSAGDGSAATLDIVVGKDGSVSSVTVLKDGVSHSLTRE